MNKQMAHFLTVFIPVRSVRRKVRDYLKHKNMKAKPKKKPTQSLLFEICHDLLILERKNTSINIRNLLSKENKPLHYLPTDSTQNYLYMLFGVDPVVYNETTEVERKEVHPFYMSWEIRPTNHNQRIMELASTYGKPLIFVGDSFLRSINTFADKTALPCYQKGISFTFDDLTSYFDATRPSRLEMMLNDKNLVLSDEQLSRARTCIDKIVTNHLTKYNSQPIFTPDIGRKGAKKVLVIDQSYNDMSIIKGLGSDLTFERMLKAAIDENPDADIIIKTHPDTMAGRGGYYTDIEPHDNIYTQTTPINPISLLQYCDKVYVCSTQFGFEALMCGKEVRVFGLPFYAGWGLTKDEQSCERRTNKRTLEEIFYITYIMYSYYVNPDKGCRCEIEEAMDYLLQLREKYFKEKNIVIKD